MPRIPIATMVPSSLQTIRHPPATKERIAFRSKGEGCDTYFSNFCLVPKGIVTTWGTYPTVEHAYQARIMQIFGFHTEALALLSFTLSPQEAKRMGNQIRHHLSDDQILWLNELKPHLMRPLIYARFADPEAASMLMATGNKHLMEANENDSYWGVGLGAKAILNGNSVNPRSLNHLGRIYAEVRDSKRGGPIRGPKTIIIGDLTMAAFEGQANNTEDLQLITVPGGTLCQILDLAEYIHYPGCQHIIVGGGYMNILPAASSRSNKEISTLMANTVAEAVTRFENEPTKFTYVPPIIPTDAPVCMQEKLSGFYDEIYNKVRKDKKGKMIAVLDLRPVTAQSGLPLTPEPAMPSILHTIVTRAIEECRAQLRMLQPGCHYQQVLSLEEDMFLLEEEICTCSKFWCLKCAVQQMGKLQRMG